MSATTPLATANVADLLSDVARSLESEQGVDETLAGIVRAAIETIQGAEHASISLVEGARVVSRAADGPLAIRCDALQTETGEGPCLEAAAGGSAVMMPDLRDEQRWPAFCAGAANEGLRSMLSLQLFVDADGLGALNLFSTRPNAFDDEAQHVGRLFAAHAAIALTGARRTHNLTAAMATRSQIGQAQGMLMAQNTISADDSFAMLVRASQRTNVKLRDLVARIVGDAEARATEKRASIEG